MTKCLFVQSKSVRFLITVTEEQIDEERGMYTRKQIQMVEDICLESPKNLIKALQPVLTKVKVSSSFDIEQRKIDLND